MVKPWLSLLEIKDLTPSFIRHYICIDMRLGQGHLPVMASKSQQLQIRVAPRQKAALKRLARAAGVDVSAYVLARALPAAGVEFAAILARLGDEDDHRYALAELNDFLRRTAQKYFHLDPSEPRVILVHSHGRILDREMPESLALSSALISSALRFRSPKGLRVMKATP